MIRAVPLPRLLRWAGLAAVPLAVFALFLLAAGADPLATYQAMFRNAIGDAYGAGEVAVRAAPFVLTALAAAIPARAGLVNVGGEGQFAVGALAATWAAVALGGSLPRPVTLAALAAAGALGGAAWSGLAGLLRVRLKLNETISTLLLNYVAFLFMASIVHGPLKDPASFNWPFSPPLAEAARFPTLGGSRVHLGIVLAVLAALALWYLLARTYWGFRLRVVGGNPEATRRAGIHVDRTLLAAMLVGGALAGLAGMVEVAGVEGRLRPTTGTGFGYAGFLAAWMAGHHPLGVLGSALLLAVIAVSGDALQIFASLPASSVNILMALVLLGVLARFGGSRT